MKTLLKLGEVAAILTLAALISFHVYGIKTDCKKTAVYVKC